MKTSITTEHAPAAIGSYSQAIKTGNTVYLSGQLPLDPKTMTIIPGNITTQAKKIFDNLQAVAEAAGGNLAAIVRLTVYLTDITTLAEVNEAMAEYFTLPYPARTSIGVAALPKNAHIEIDAIMVL